MGLFDKIFGTGSKIKVQFIDSDNGQTIGISEMTASQLPETFSLQTTMHYHNDAWVIEEAIPENSIDFIKTKSLILKMRKTEKIDLSEVWFTTPTISNEFPRLEPKTRDTAYDLGIHEDDYRQREFLSPGSTPKIEEEFVGIREVWSEYSKKSGDITVFKNCHVRKTIGPPNLVIDFKQLKSLLECKSVGQVIINERTLSNGFVIRTDNTTYFGTLDGETVIELCMANWNEESTNEILEINQAFNLVFVNWTHCDLVI
ncbi:hypothetical protein [Flavihumibacter petaseus]|uniref:Uncharacterized protein n=1 Tax=Flavihumibacter petaseus NBRC 106054 TaxID=1220578 RepID=A0A0E9N6B2_9BACT|nr:hypothetical protein [Flavihumibacter petaseus]GAO45353.1 hypothetical protein FPE01S_05_00500 [Flavihumibacter petaseus NBRC 106054]